MYLAGLYSRVSYLFTPPPVDNMDLYLAGPIHHGTGAIKQEATMNLYLAGEHDTKNGRNALSEDVMVLESYYYAKDNRFITALIPKFRKFLLDSGAFTFMQGKGAAVNWDNYVDQYAEFILANNVTRYFEMDIDSIAGLREVERLRDRLETKTNRKCIPVWHKSRGKDYWIKMAKEYDYVAIGGIVSGEIKKDEFRYFPALIQMAGEHGAKVHGLGFTQLAGLTKYKFYSVDSTAWLYGNRSGFVQRFNGETLVKISAPAGMKMKARETAIYNFNEWVKFQRYAEKHL